MIDLLMALLKRFEDPALSLSVGFIVVLIWQIIRQEKTITHLRECIDGSIAENNLTTRELVTLVGVMVHGRVRNGNP